MAVVQSILIDALQEIGVLAPGEPMTDADAQLALLRFQNQIDSWAADRVTLSIQGQLPIPWPAATSTQTIGPGGDIDTQRPVWINALNYVIPGTSPAVETPMGPMDQDSYANLSIKALQSGLPTLFFYQTSIDTVLGSLYIWPQPTSTVTLMLYAPKAVAVPATLTDVLLGPPGYQEAFMYQLALRLCGPFAKQPPPLLPGMAAEAYQRMKRPNLLPGLLGVDQALVPSMGSGYNVLNDSSSAPGGR